MDTIAKRWEVLKSDIISLSSELGRSVPIIIAVSKTRTLNEVQQAIDCGINDFGENNPKEFRIKSEKYPDQSWHFVGHLQRNNVGDVAPTATSIHSLDRQKLANRLTHFEYSGDCFIQVNLSEEDSKSGVVFDKNVILELLDYSRNLGLCVVGLMAIGHPGWDDSETLKQYKILVALGKDLGLNQFSLGMSGDWRLAVKAGATHIRIGTAIFGSRQS